MSSAYASLHEALRDAIAKGLGWGALRPVQELTIAAVRRGSNVVVLAPTAGGKTEAAVIPVLDATLTAAQESGPSVLYICPLRALLNNLEGRIRHLYGLVGLSAFKWHGDVEDRKKRAFVADPADLLMTTPESLEAMLVSARTDTRALFANVRFVVIDEVHAFAADDRGAHLMCVLERVQACSRHDIQRIALSATVGNPELLLDWLAGSSQRARELVSPPKPPSPKALRVVSVPPGDSFAEVAAKEAEGKKALMFVESRRQAEAAAGALRHHIPQVFVHHSSVSREERAQAEAAFGEVPVAAIVATATLELGIDVGDLDLVQQLEAPRTVSSFLQRLGRTGRRGDAARMTFYATDAFHLVQAMAVVELAKRGWVEPVAPLRRSWHVLVHQLLVSALENPGLVVSELFTKLRVAWPFVDITEDELVGLVRHLATLEILEARGGTIALGPEGERRFSARNYFDLFAVFQGAREMSVRTENGDDVGTLQTSYVLTQNNADFVFVLAGRRWQAVEVNSEAGLIWAKPAPEGNLPRWHSPMGGFVSRTVIEEHRRILASSDVPAYVTEAAKLELARTRETWADVAGEEGWVLRSSPRGVIVHTFAGGRVNLTLAKALGQRLGCATSSEEYTFSVRGTGSITTAHVADELRQFTSEGFGDDLRAAVTASLPRRPLSKFQTLLPPLREREFLETRVFAFDDAAAALHGRTLAVQG